MTQMNTLTVNGKTYTVADPDAAHIDDTVIGDSAWSGKNIIDRLCPAFTVSGDTVKCQPVEGYPLQVITQLPASEAGYTQMSLRLMGKNLYDKDAHPLTAYYIRWDDGTEKTSSNFVATRGYISVSHLAGKQITLNHCPNAVAPGTNAGMAFYDEDKGYITGSNEATVTVPQNAAYMRFSVPKEYDAGDIQIELGAESTGCEPFCSGLIYVQVFMTRFYGGSYNWATGELCDESGALILSGGGQRITALPGTNVLCSGEGTITVTGRADLPTLLQSLTEM